MGESMAERMDRTTLEAILDEKFRTSYLQLEKERKSSVLYGAIQLVSLIAMTALFIATVHFIFWGAGFSVFAKEQHNYTVSILTTLSGPQGDLVRTSVAEKGYLSLADYKRSVDMANDFKVGTLKQTEPESAP